MLDDMVDAVNEANNQIIDAINAMMDRLSGGDLAAVQSAEWYQQQYGSMLAGGDAEAFMAFLPEYLDFMSAFGTDYATLVAQAMVDLEYLKVGILGDMPMMASGGLTSGLTIAGETPEWIVPVNDPENSAFLNSVGVDPEKIGQAIAKVLVGTIETQGGDIHVHIEIDGNEIGNVVAKQYKSNENLIQASRSAA